MTSIKATTTSEEAYSAYLKERDSHKSEIFFFADCAKFLADKGDKALALRSQPSPRLPFHLHLSLFILPSFKFFETLGSHLLKFKGNRRWSTPLRLCPSQSLKR